MTGGRRRRIRLLALDLDGTLVGDDLRIRPRTVAAVRAAVDAGVAVAIVTGRMTSSALPYARELGLRVPIVGMQGALIRWWHTHRAFHCGTWGNTAPRAR